ncbi:MAG: hypothetical protein ACOY99_08200, partial [Pseudomonadota bacterium]
RQSNNWPPLRPARLARQSNNWPPLRPARLARQSNNWPPLRPAMLDDALLVETLTKAVRGASVTLTQRVLRRREYLVGAEVKVALLGAALAPARLPPRWRRLFAATLAAKPGSLTAPTPFDQ